MQVLCRPRLSLCVAMTMAIPYFLGFSFLETRAETWCNLPVAYGIYLVVRLIKQKSNGYVPSLTVTQGAMLGVSVMACLLIKWSIAAMMMSLCLAVLLLSLKSGKKLLVSLAAFIGGAVILALPVMAYLICVGAFVPFWQEYFMATSTTVGVGESFDAVGFYLNQARRIYHSPISMMTILLALPGSYMLFRRNGWIKWLLPLCCCIFFAIGSFRNHWLYYLQASLSFAELGLIWIAMVWSYKAMPVANIVFYGLCTAIGVIYLHTLYPIYHTDRDFVDVDSIDRTLNGYFSGDNMPTILCYECLDVGIGMKVEALPANKYWFKQNGAHEEMKKGQYNALKSRRADIVYTFTTEHDSLIRSYGYSKIHEAADSIPLGKVRVYIKSPNP